MDKRNTSPNAGRFTSRVKVKINADQSTATALRTLVQKVADADLATTPDDVQVMAWLLELAREINMAGATQLAMNHDRGHEMVLVRQ